VDAPRQKDAGRDALATSQSKRGAGILVVLAFGIISGTVANGLGLPLAWMLGPLILCACLTMAGLPLRPVPWGREVGQIIVGLAIGLRLTSPVVASTLSLLPAMLVVTIAVMIATTMSALLLRRLADVDRKTAFFSTAAAGMAEMANLAHQRGADSQAVSVFHAIRVASIVTVVPLIVYHWGSDGGVADSGMVLTEANELKLAVLFPVAVVSAFVARRLHIPNPWIMGPICVAAVASAVGGFTLAVPWLPLVAAQIVIGIALGCRFQRELLRRLPRVVGSALLISGLMVVAAAIAAKPLSAATGLPYATSFLAIAPAGVTEMVLTARVMHLDTASITAFHLMRIGLVTASAVMILKLFERLSEALDSRLV
jgi:membrane AbrB-like protein